MRVALVGSGNSLFMDEGIGLYAAKYLKENYVFESELHIVDGGTLGFGLMPLLQEYEQVIIANTSSSDEKEAGTIEVISDVELMESSGLKKTANEVEIAEMLQICSMADQVARTTIVSIVPEDIISVKVDLTPIMKVRWEEYIAMIVSQIERCGIACKRCETGITLDQVLEIFANPSIEHARGF